MSQSIVFDSPCEDTKYSTNIKEELLDANSGTVIDNIKPGSPCSTLQDEIDIKEDPLVSNDECELNVDLRSSEPLKPIYQIYTFVACIMLCRGHFVIKCPQFALQDRVGGHQQLGPSIGKTNDTLS